MHYTHYRRLLLPVANHYPKKELNHRIITGRPLFKFVAIVAMCFFASFVSGQTRGNSENSPGNMFSGSVFIAGNAQDQAFGSTQGIQGVAVSDGLNVVITDDEGRFELPYRPETRFIFYNSSGWL